jgi:hypothetical protein
MKLIAGVEEALHFSNKNGFTNAMAFILVFLLPKTLNRYIIFTLHLNGSWPLLNHKFEGCFKPVKTIIISINLII